MITCLLRNWICPCSYVERIKRSERAEANTVGLTFFEHYRLQRMPLFSDLDWVKYIICLSVENRTVFPSQSTEDMRACPYRLKVDRVPKF